MAYNTYEQSVAQGQPIELYRFAHGVQRWFYCTGLNEIAYNSELYTPDLIKRGEIRLTDNAFDREINIEVSRNNLFAQEFIPGPLDRVTTVEIYRGHGTDFVTYWQGVVGAVTFDDKTATIRCTPKTSSLKRIGLRRKYQIQCPYPIYSTKCKVNKESYKVTGVISSVSGLNVTAAGISTKSDGWFVGGEFVCGESRRMIIEHTGSTIKISSPIIGMSASDSYTAYAGCDHKKETCRDKFNNKLNFGGQPYIPTKNPFTGDAIV